MNSYKVGESLEIMGDSYLITEEGAKHCRKVIIEYYNRSPEAAAALSNALGGSIEESLPELKFMDADVEQAKLQLEQMKMYLLLHL